VDFFSSREKVLKFQSMNIPTMSWWLAENGATKVGFSYIELGAEKIGQEQVRN
jgi:hypothetical protein